MDEVPGDTLRALVERLIPYLMHLEYCTIQLAKGKCSCGLEAALASSKIEKDN